MNYIFENKKTLIASVLLASFFSAGQLVFGAGDPTANKVYFQGPAYALAPESEFLVGIFLDARDSINAFDVEIVYPQDKLKFLNFDNTHSIVDIWQASPTLLPNGNIRLTGGMLKPFNGNGLLINLSFRALDLGQTVFLFSKSNLYLADGKGTEIKAPQETFALSIEEDGTIVSSPGVPFKSTTSDILIKQELETFKSAMLLKKISILLLIFAGIFLGMAMYTKLKRKKL